MPGFANGYAYVLLLVGGRLAVAAGVLDRQAAAADVREVKMIISTRMSGNDPKPSFAVV
jgi:hypothetical protein